MNIFRLLADLAHLASIGILLLKIRKSHSVNGISKKAQILYTVVFVSRYLDVFTHFVSLYNTLMKVFFIGSSSYILYLFHKFKNSVDDQQDQFNIYYLLGPSALLALIFHYNWHPLELLWTFSIFLESVAVLPQLYLLQRTGEAENITTHYLFALGSYRVLYILNWIYRLATESGYTDYIAWAGGLVQSVLYGDFFYVYFTKVLRGLGFTLPT